MSPINDSDRPPPAADRDWQAAWETEDNYWHENFTSRPYALGPDFYERFRPAFRYGFESGQHHMGRTWEEAEPDLRRGWEAYPHRGTNPAAWEEIRDAVRDAWARISGHDTAESERRNPQIRE
jgi:hypothetical protein